MKIYHGTILSVNQNNDIFQYLVEDEGKIIYTGNHLPDNYKQGIQIELHNKVLIPPFADTHQHLASFSAFHAGLNVMDASSNKEILDMIREFTIRSENKILIAFGASPYSVKEGTLVNRSQLDTVTCNKPLFLVKYDGHACVVNTALLNKLPKKIKKLRGYHPDTGEMNQEAFFAVSDYITNSLSIPELIKNMQKAIDYEASKGIGMIHSVSGVGFALNMDITMETLFARSLQNGFQLRIFPQSMNIKTAQRRHLPRIGGCFACALDGCFGSQDAAMIEPYANDKTNNGILYYTDQQVTDFCIKANRAGLQIEMHAIGDKAFNQAAKAIKTALDDTPRQDHRHGIIHACLPTEEGIQICKEYNIQLPMQIAFDNWRQEPSSYTEVILGKDRNNNLNPIKTFLDNNCKISFGSDAPCTEPDPIMWLAKAVNHSNPQQQIAIQDALRIATYNGYWATFDEKERGSLEPGKIADMLILSENPYTTPKDKLINLKAEQLILQGKPYQPQTQSIPQVILKGLIH